MMIHTLSNLPGEYENVIEKFEEELYDDIDALTVKIILDNL